MAKTVESMAIRYFDEVSLKNNETFFILANNSYKTRQAATHTEDPISTLEYSLILEHLKQRRKDVVNKIVAAMSSTMSVEDIDDLYDDYEKITESILLFY